MCKTSSIWIYNPAIKTGLSKKLCSLWHGPFRLVEKTTPVTFRVTHEKEKGLKATVHGNGMKQFYSPLDKPYNGTSPTVIKQNVKDLNDESELLSDEADEMDEIESDTDANSIAKNEKLYKRFLINI